MIDPLSFSIPLSAKPAAPALPKRKLLTPSPDHPDDYILELDYSSLSTFLCCPRRAENQLIHSRQRAGGTSATSFGQLFHSCEELRLEHGLTPIVEQKQKELVSAHYLAHPVPPEEYRTGARMLDVLAKYNARYRDDRWPEAVLVHEGEKFVERAFKIELATVEVNGELPYSIEQLTGAKEELGTMKVRNIHILFTGRIDAILTNSNLLFVVDHKTTSREDGFAESFRLSLQTRGYVWAAQHILGRPLAGCIINEVLVRPPLKTDRGKNDREKFDRLTYFYSEDIITEWEQNMRAHLSDFVACLQRGFFPQVALSFMSPCLYCDYRDNCTLPFSQRAADLSSDLYADVTWNPVHL